MKLLLEHPSDAHHNLIDYKVIDQNGAEIGSVYSLWADPASDQLEFIGVTTGWLGGTDRVIPAERAQVDEAQHVIHVPYGVEQIKGAPSFDPHTELTREQAAGVYQYYGVGAGTTAGVGAGTTAGLATGTTAGLAAAPTGASATRQKVGASAREAQPGEAVEVTLTEEQLVVGKRSVEAGGVRLRKIVRTEQVNVPVELRREDVVIERIPATEVREGVAASAFQEQTIDVPLHREEAVVAKESHVTGAVRAHKTEEVERQTVTDAVRKEDVEVIREGDLRAGPQDIVKGRQP
ncbi:MAG TPA: PRC and DUF2382 domain-containing protein [Chthoniobacterales bacterium]